jgi:hypothetical protein
MNDANNLQAPPAPGTLAAIDPPLLTPLESPEKLDPQILNSRLREIQVLQTKRSLEPTETREGITLIQILRGTMSTAGPKSSARAKPKKVSSLADFEASLGLLSDAKG